MDVSYGAKFPEVDRESQGWNYGRAGPLTKEISYCLHVQQGYLSQPLKSDH